MRGGFSPLTVEYAAIRLGLAKKEPWFPGIGAGGAFLPHPATNGSCVGRPNWAKVEESERGGPEDTQGGQGHCWHI